MHAFASLIAFASAVALIQPPEVAPPPREKIPIVEVPQPRERHALIICGHPGDAEHTKAFGETVRKLGDGLTKTVGIPRERQHVLFGTENPKDIPGGRGPATREAVAAAVAEVRKSIKPEDGLWVICLGHGYHDGRQAWWNLPGPDLSAAEFGKLFAEVNCREQVFAMTFSLSGYFVTPLAKRDRVVIAATEADYWVHSLHADNGQVLVRLLFPVAVLRGLARKAYRAGKHRVGGDGGHSEVVLIPVSDILTGRAWE